MVHSGVFLLTRLWSDLSAAIVHDAVAVAGGGGEGAPLRGRGEQAEDQQDHGLVVTEEEEHVGVL